jgi:hypothetical protein
VAGPPKYDMCFIKCLSYAKRDVCINLALNLEKKKSYNKVKVASETELKNDGPVKTA